MSQSSVETGAAEVNGTSLYFESRGSGPPILLLHGFTLDRRMWNRQGDALAARHRVIAYDARGFGRSAPPGAQPYRHCDDAAALCEHLGLRRVVAVGHSIGAHQTLELALSRPDLVAGWVAVCMSGLGGIPFPLHAEPRRRQRLRMPPGVHGEHGHRLRGQPRLPEQPPSGWTAMTVCYAGTFTASSDFGGFYQHQGGTCTVANPMAGGACACPSGSQAIELVVDGSCYLNDNVALCFNPAATLASFGGAYQVSDNTSYGTSGCVVKNPATNACTCPTGTTAVGLENEYAPSTSGCSNAGISSGHLYVCQAP